MPRARAQVATSRAHASRRRCALTLTLTLTPTLTPTRTPTRTHPNPALTPCNRAHLLHSRTPVSASISRASLHLAAFRASPASRASPVHLARIPAHLARISRTGGREYISRAIDAAECSCATDRASGACQRCSNPRPLPPHPPRTATPTPTSTPTPTLNLALPSPSPSPHLTVTFPTLTRTRTGRRCR